MTKQDPVREAAEKHVGWDQYDPELKYSTCKLRFDLKEREADFIAGARFERERTKPVIAIAKDFIKQVEKQVTFPPAEIDTLIEAIRAWEKESK